MLRNGLTSGGEALHEAGRALRRYAHGDENRAKGSMMMRCEICGEQAFVHETEIADGHVLEHHWCERHGEGAIVDAAARAAMRGGHRVVMDLTLKSLRELRRFAYQHGRLPETMAELEQAEAGAKDVAGVEIVDPVVRKKLLWMERMQAFVEKHRRMPGTVEEWAEVEAGLR